MKVHSVCPVGYRITRLPDGQFELYRYAPYAPSGVILVTADKQEAIDVAWEEWQSWSGWREQSHLRGREILREWKSKQESGVV
jgi:hypothetical protein